MVEQADRAARFLAMHLEDEPLLMPNAWDAGSARILESLGFRALGTTSSGAALAHARLDGELTREQTLEHAATLAAASALPVSADLENGFAEDPDAVRETVAAAALTGVAGCSIEDHTGSADAPIYELGLARERVRAAAEAAHSSPARIVLTARAENHLHGRDDLEDTIARLQAYAEAGADVLYAPGLVRLQDIRRVVLEVARPLNVLALANAPTVAELASVGVKRISVGGALAYAALGSLVEGARELKESGTYSFWEQAAVGRAQAHAAFGDP